MKLIKRKNAMPMLNASMWILPTMAYSIGKIVGTVYNQYEYYWWIIIPLFFSIWLVSNFKISK